MKKVGFLLAIFLIIGCINAQKHYQLRSDAEQGITVESSTANGLELHYTLSEIGIADIANGEAKGQEIILKGQFAPNAEGLPNLPFENLYIAVPQGATVNVSVKENASTTLEDIDLLPAAPIQTNNAVGLPKLSRNMDVFGKDTDFPSKNVTVAQTTKIRGLDVVLLNITPFRYNPVRKTLEVIYDMDIELRFEGGNGQFGEVRFRNPDWDNILRNLVVNSDMLPEAHYLDYLNNAIRNGEEGCEYLIIAPDDDSVVTWANVLMDFRNRQGILTKVVTTTECGGNTPEAIKNYIKNAYEHWAIPPAALMIFCANLDTEAIRIPGFPLTFLNYDNGVSLVNYDYISDNPYSDMNGDSIPDLALSRLPSSNLDEYKTNVEKIIQYETNPPTRSDFYDQPIITSSYENNKWFMITSQSVNGFFQNKLGRHPKNFYMIYEYSYPAPPIPDSAWSTGYNTSVPVDYFGPDGQNYIPRYIGALDDWRSMMDNSYLVNALNNGSFFTLYRDHSAQDWWCSPIFNFFEIWDLTNVEPSFILSIGCNTATFSTNYHNGTPEPPSILQTFCNTNTGALGGIGASTVTHSHFNDILTWGIVDHIWPDFMPTLGSTTPSDFVRPSYSLVAGKLFLQEHAFLPNMWPIKITTTNNVFHYLGEAYLSLCTSVPQPMTVEAPLYQSDNQQQYSFTAEEGSVVCLSQNNTILHVVEATGTMQSIQIPPMETGETFTFTATKQNRSRFEQTVTVVSAAQPYIYLKATEIRDQDGNGQFDYGEYADIDITLHNFTQVASNGGTATLHCDSPYLEILQDEAQFPQINPDEMTVLKKAFRIKLSANVPDQTSIPFSIEFTGDAAPHGDNFFTIANAPLIEIERDFRPSTADGEPATHISTEGRSAITFTIDNIGHSPVDLLTASLDIKAPFINVETPPIKQEGLQPGEKRSCTFNLNTLPNSISGAWLQSNLAIQYGERHVCLDTVVQYGGIFEDFETDTLNPALRWGNTGSYQWQYCSDDAYSGTRCMISNANESHFSRIMARQLNSNGNETILGKISFRYKTDENEYIEITGDMEDTQFMGSGEWEYGEVTCTRPNYIARWIYQKQDSSSVQAKIDNLCFPPLHTTIAYAGDDLVVCDGHPVELNNAYAYDCEAILWATEGDGRFSNDSIATPMYYPRIQDINNGTVTLTLSAFGDDTIVSSTQIRFMDGIELGAIEGDSEVNKYQQPISHYSIDDPFGLRYHWELDPVEAGCIFDFGHEIDIRWNLHEGDAEVTLSVTAENECATAPSIKPISLVGEATDEWQSIPIELFPNPTDGVVNIVLGENSQGKILIEVFNILGERLLVSKAQNLSKSETITLDLSHLSPSLYIIKVNTAHGSTCIKTSVR